MVAGRGLVVTAPPRCSRADVAGAVAAHRDWAIERLAALEDQVPPAFRHWPPRGLELPAVGRRLVIGYEPGPGSGRGTGTGSGTGRGGGRSGGARSSIRSEAIAVLRCDPHDRRAVSAGLASHLAHEARAHLGPRLAFLGGRHGLAWRRLTVRGQRTRWGSCSSTGTISLNWKLLFLRPALVDYVLLHELAHTRHLDHSKAFWALLERICPGARALDAELGTAGPKVPPWFG